MKEKSLPDPILSCALPVAPLSSPFSLPFLEQSGLRSDYFFIDKSYRDDYKIKVGHRTLI